MSEQRTAVDKLKEELVSVPFDIESEIMALINRREQATAQRDNLNAELSTIDNFIARLSRWKNVVDASAAVLIPVLPSIEQGPEATPQGGATAKSNPSRLREALDAMPLEDIANA